MAYHLTWIAVSQELLSGRSAARGIRSPYWIDQHVSLVMFLEERDMFTELDNCEDKKGDPGKFASCVQREEEWTLKAKRCLAFARKKCRDEGGRC